MSVLQRVCATIGALALCVSGATAQPVPEDAARYPSKPIRLVVPFPPGGPTDVVARAIGRNLSETWRQPVIIDNRPGGNGFIGAEAVVKSAPDGYTLFVPFFGTLVVNPSLYSSMPYDPVRDFAPITILGTLPLMLVVKPSSPIHSIGELIALAKEKPNTLTFASGGPGQGAHLAGELLKSMAGISMIHIPYKGNAPAVTDVIGGHVDMIFDGMTTSLPHVKAGTLRGVAVSTRTRASAFPDLPTVAESGLPGFDVGSWFGIMARAGTPEPIVAKLNAEIVRIMRGPELQALMAKSGLEPMPGTPAEFSAYMAAEAAKWAKVVQEAGIKAD